MDPGCESCRKKVIGKSYPGKLNLRFDEEELEMGHPFILGRPPGFYGHFFRPELKLPWEKMDKVNELKKTRK